MSEPLVIHHHVAAPLTRVWDLWTTVPGLAAWWWSFLDGTTYEIDPQVGGTYRIENGASGFGVRGSFLVVERHERLVASWIWLDGGTDGDVEELEVRFAADGEGTMLTITHRGPWTTSKPAEAYAQGWADTLAQLDLVTS